MLQVKNEPIAEKQIQNPFIETITDDLEREIRKVIQIKSDAFGNSTLDLTEINFTDKDFRKKFKTLLPKLVQEEEEKGKHVFTIKFTPNSPHLYSYVLQAGFKYHQAHSSHAIVTRCLHNHDVEKCKYPAYKSMSVGSTTVIFNSDLTKFLAVKENSGPYRGWKAPTGTVDYEKETPHAAAVRKVFEETHCNIEAERIKYVGNIWTKDFRGDKPDQNFVFATQCSTSEEIIAEEDEISEAGWLDVDEFLKSELPVSHSNRPLILQKVVEVARQTLKNEPMEVSGEPLEVYWGSGKPAIFYFTSRL